MQGAEERRLRRMSNTPQGEAIEGNAADDALMVNQGEEYLLDRWLKSGTIAIRQGSRGLRVRGRSIVRKDLFLRRGK